MALKTLQLKVDIVIEDGLSVYKNSWIALLSNVVRLKSLHMIFGRSKTPTLSCTIHHCPKLLE
jgi:hypothetical protein